MFVAVCLAAMFALAESSCENTPDLATLRRRFCQADVVFHGIITGGSSSLSIDSTGQEFASSRFHFVISEYLKMQSLDNQAFKVGQKYQDILYVNIILHFNKMFLISPNSQIAHPRAREAETQVLRSYALGSPCDIRPFSYGGSDHLVFGTGTRGDHGVRVDPCNFNPDWNCLPNAFKQHYADADFCTA